MQPSEIHALDWFRFFIAPFGGTAIVFSALFGWLGKRYLEKRLEAERSQYAIAIEKLKSSFEKYFYLYKAQFELEFKTYQEIWTACATLMDDVARLVNLYHLTELPTSKGEKHKLAENADNSFFTAFAVIHNNEPFIPIAIFELAVAHSTACKKEIDYFFGAIRAEENGDKSYKQGKALTEARTRVREILDQFTKLADGIRTRLASLTVLDI
jgi:hypothetical protein